MERLGHYQLEELLGQGGMARVFRALDTRLGRHVALKVLHEHVAASPKAAARFHREARLAAALHHPNVVTVHDCSEPGDETLYLVTELVEGGSLRQWIERGPMLPEEAALVMLPVARALAAAHALGVVHRDVKPDNILIDSSAAAVVVKLADFGVALSADEPRITTDGGLSGSVVYMAPEQLRTGETSPASDIWSAGVTLYELIGGRAPQGSGTVGQLVARILERRPEDDPLAELPNRELVCAGLAAVLRRCLAVDPAARYSDGGELAPALESALQEAGIDRVESEIDLWGRDPGYRVDLSQRVADRLVGQARQIGSLTGRAELLDRALALVPDHPGALELLGGPVRMAGSTGFVRRRWPFLVAVAALVAIATSALLRHHGRRDTPSPLPPPVRVVADVAGQGGARTPDAAAAAGPVDAARLARRSKRSDGGRPRRARPPRGPGAVQLTTEPWAEVVVDGRSLGFTPKLQRFELAAGEHRLELLNPLCRSRRLTLRLSPGETLLRHVKLEILPARLRVRAPRGWTVEVDGRVVGVAPLSGPLNLSHGGHSVRVVSPTGERHDRQLRLTAGRTLTVEMGQ